MRIDVFAHALPEPVQRHVLDHLDEASSPRNWRTLRTLFDVDLRLAQMDRHGIDVQVITTPSPPLESLFRGSELRAAASLANEAMSEIVEKHGDRLRGVGTVPLGDVDWAIEEARRCVRELQMVGLLVYANPDGRPLDDPALEPFYSAIEDLGVPLWLHPERSRARADYVGEPESRYAINMILGWPFETSVAMARLAFSGTLRRHPGLKVIAHHAGAMIPFFANRIEMHFRPPEGADPFDGSIIDEFRRFYVDTVTWGSVSALMNSYDVFGLERMMFATDAPFGPEMGEAFVRSTIQAVERMPISEADRHRIWHRTAAELCGIEGP